ncbi:hypothetical protein M0R45_036081 [Rubus argutus]|uniref:Secreted protein n=1 Tax=Rubus argutus TaxID=59490 RepID=A0AAW1VXK6_RUBAR
MPVLLIAAPAPASSSFSLLAAAVISLPCPDVDAFCPSLPTISCYDAVCPQSPSHLSSPHRRHLTAAHICSHSSSSSSPSTQAAVSSTASPDIPTTTRAQPALPRLDFSPASHRREVLCFAKPTRRCINSAPHRQVPSLTPSLSIVLELERK